MFYRYFTLLTVLASSCSGCGGEYPSVEQRDAWIADHRQRLLDGGDTIHLYSTTNTNVLLTQLAGMPEVKRISLEETNDLSQEGLAQLKNYPNLRELAFYGESIVDDSTIQHLTACENLESIYICYYSNTKNIGLSIDGVTKLRAELPNCQVTVERLP